MNSLEVLTRQFAKSIGYEGQYNNFKEFEQEFLSWLKMRQELLGDYVFFLQELGFEFTDNTTAEIGKTCFDSAVIPFESTIITPYVDKYSRRNLFNLKDRLIPGIFSVDEIGSPTVLTEQEIKPSFLSLYDVNTFITHNPYSPSDIKNWDNLHNSGDYNVLLGVFGNIYEKDKDEKIKLLWNFRNALADQYYLESYYVCGDKYFYVVGSDHHEVGSVRTLLRN